MKQLKVLLAVISLILWVNFAASAQDVSDLKPAQEIEAIPQNDTLMPFIEGVVISYMREHDVPGVSLSIVRGGNVLYTGGYGRYDEDNSPVTKDTLFRMGSVSKTFSWTALMMLVDGEKVDLDADINTYLKDLQIPEAFDTPITVRDLVSHRTGFEDSFRLFTGTDDDPILNLKNLKRDMPLRVQPPGQRGSYSNYGSILASKIVEDVSGVPYQEFVRTRILDPLDMNDTFLVAPGKLPDRLNFSKSFNGSKTDSYMQGNPYSPIGFMTSTSADMAQWMLVHLGGGELDGLKLMTKAGHAKMRERAYPDRASAPGMLHGFMEDEYRGVKMYGHGGAIDNFRSSMNLIPELDIGIYISINSAPNRSLVSDLVHNVIDHAKGHEVAVLPEVDKNADLSAYTGTYLSNRRNWSTLVAAGRIGTESKVSTKDGLLTITANGKSRRYRPVPGTSDLFLARNGERILFTRDDDGVVRSYAGTYNQSSERVGFFDQSNFIYLAFALMTWFSLTTVIGAWRQQGRQVVQTKSGRRLGIFDFLSAVLIFSALASLIYFVSDTANAGADRFPTWPFFSAQLVRFMYSVVVVLAIPLLISLYWCWRKTGWSIWRKMHHTVFALAVILGALAALKFNLAFSSL